MDGYHDGVRHTITRELLGRLGGSAKVQAMLGSMGLRYAGSDVPGWRVTMMELVIPVPYSYGHSVVLDWKPI